jgi:hypothetical protein
MARDAWGLFLRYAEWARAKPRFDEEERDFKPPLAQKLAEMLAAVAGGADATAELERAFGSFGDLFEARLYTLTLPRERDWLLAWAREDPVGVREALLAFSPATDPQERFRRFAAVAARSRPDPEAEAGEVLAIGSLLNFALAPGELPILRHGLIEPVELRLGWDAEWSGTPERYEGHLAFARLAQGRMADAGIAVRDMMDAQSLLFIAAQERALWIDGIEPGQLEPPNASRISAPDRRRPEVDVAVCAVYRDESPYLREWVAFHKLMGVERFFLYDNGSVDDHLEALEPYLADGTVVLEDWQVFPGQLQAYDHVLSLHRHEARWIAFFDIDEFLFSPTGRLLPELLAGYERWPAVVVNYAMFGTSGHQRMPQGLVTENFTHRIDSEIGRYVKSVVNPRCTERCLNAHQFVYRDGFAVDENGYPVRGSRTKSVSLERLRINHYYTRSEEEHARKGAKPSAVSVASSRWRPAGPRIDIDEWRGGTPDDAISVHLPALRRELEVAAGGSART